MPEKEFRDLMSGKKSYNTAWESALLACESLHLMSENMQKMAELKHKNEGLANAIANVQQDIENFSKETAERTAKVIESTPLVIQEIKTPPRIIDQLKRRQITSRTEMGGGGHFQTNLATMVPDASLTPPDVKKAVVTGVSNDESNETEKDKEKSEQCKGLEALADSLTKALDPSPGVTPSQLFDDVETPDDKARLDFIRGIRNINYDIDFSDGSAENSTIDDLVGDTPQKPSSFLGGITDSTSLDMLSTHSLDLDQLPGATKTLMDDSPGAIGLESPLKPFVSMPIAATTTVFSTTTTKTSSSQKSTNVASHMVDYKGGFSVLNKIPSISCSTGNKCDSMNDQNESK